MSDFGLRAKPAAPSALPAILRDLANTVAHHGVGEQATAEEIVAQLTAAADALDDCGRERDELRRFAESVVVLEKFESITLAPIIDWARAALARVSPAEEPT